MSGRSFRLSNLLSPFFLLLVGLKPGDVQTVFQTVKPDPLELVD
ncbi:MAG: hypothetical protein ABSG94_08900 [Brevinematales bacterium]